MRGADRYYNTVVSTCDMYPWGTRDWATATLQLPSAVHLDRIALPTALFDIMEDAS